MADYTIPGIIGIVAVVLVAAVFLQTSVTTETSGNVVGEATTLAGTPQAQTCEPTRYCSGTKLVIVREDCSLAEAYCRSGCVDEPQAMCA